MPLTKPGLVLPPLSTLVPARQPFPRLRRDPACFYLGQGELLMFGDGLAFVSRIPSWSHAHPQVIRGLG